MDNPYSLTRFGVPTNPNADATPAFQAAIDAVYDDMESDAQSRGGIIEVPWRESGYNITGLNMRSHVTLRGMGGFVTLKNPNSATEHTIICDGADGSNGDLVHRWSTIENFHIQGAGQVFGSQNAIHCTAHDNTHIRHCRIRRHGGAAIWGQKGASSKSDGLVIDSCWLDDNSYGVYLNENSHYCTMLGTNRVTNNKTNNLRISCVGFSAFGGVINITEAGESAVELINCNGGGFFGTEFEATPALDSGTATAIKVGDTVDGACRGFGFYGCIYTGSGNVGDITMFDVENALGAFVSGGFMDGNCAGDILGFDVKAGADKFTVDALVIGGNVGAGGFTNISDNGNLTSFSVIEAS